MRKLHFDARAEESHWTLCAMRLDDEQVKTYLVCDDLCMGKESMHLECWNNSSRRVDATRVKCFFLAFYAHYAYFGA